MGIEAATKLGGGGKWTPLDSSSSAGGDSPLKVTGKKMSATQGSADSKDAGVTYFGDKGKSVKGGPSENQASKDGTFASSHKGGGKKTLPSTQSFKDARGYENAREQHEKSQARKLKSSSSARAKFKKDAGSDSRQQAYLKKVTKR